MRRTKTVVRFNRKARDAESNLPAVRVSRGLSVVELCVAAQINQSSYLQLSTGEQAPVWINKWKGNVINDVKPSVKRILKVLKCEFAELFPRYACKLSVNYMTDDQITELSISSFSVTGQVVSEEWLEKLFAALTYKEQTVIEEIIFDDKTLQHVADMLNLSRERIRQIQAKAFRKLRRLKPELLYGFMAPANKFLARIAEDVAFERS